METVEHLLNRPIYARQRQAVFGHDNISKDLNRKPGKIGTGISQEDLETDCPRAVILSTRWDQPLPISDKGEQTTMMKMQQL